MSAASLRALSITDRMPAGLRNCVHEFGLPIVEVLTKHGIKDPQHIREIVREVWFGARQHGQRSDAYDTIDTLLMATVGQLSLKAMCRILADSSLVIASCEPSRAMLDASMAEVSNFDVKCSKEEKHRRRLRAALRVAQAEMLKR